MTDGRWPSSGKSTRLRTTVLLSPVGLVPHGLQDVTQPALGLQACIQTHASLQYACSYRALSTLSA